MIEYRYGFNAISLPSMLFPRRKSEKEFVWYKRNDTDWYEEAKCIDFLVFIFARVSFVMYDTSIEKSEMLVVHELYCIVNVYMLNISLDTLYHMLKQWAYNNQKRNA